MGVCELDLSFAKGESDMERVCTGSWREIWSSRIDWMVKNETDDWQKDIGMVQNIRVIKEKKTMDGFYNRRKQWEKGDDYLGPKWSILIWSVSILRFSNFSVSLGKYNESTGN